MRKRKLPRISESDEEDGERAGRSPAVETELQADAALEPEADEDAKEVNEEEEDDGEHAKPLEEVMRRTGRVRAQKCYYQAFELDGDDSERTKAEDLNQEDTDVVRTAKKQRIRRPSSKRRETDDLISSDKSIVSKGDELVNGKEHQKEKKRVKITKLPRRRVERRTINITDFNLDPKKMTMKEIIRYAESKEREMQKNTAKPKHFPEKASSANEVEGETVTGASFVPRVQLIDGKIVINQDSLTVAAQPKDDIHTYTRVEETHSKLNYHSYLKKSSKIAWSKEDTDLFYKALRDFGTNFAIIQHLFPGMSRRQIFLKFKREEKCNPLRVAEAFTLRANGCSQYMEVMNRLKLQERASDSCMECPSNSIFAEEESESPVDSVGPSDKGKLHLHPLESKFEGSKEHYVAEEPSPIQIDGSMGVPEKAETPEHNESHRTESPVPHSKSLFSYQTAGSKPFKSLFSYQCL